MYVRSIDSSQPARETSSSSVQSHGSGFASAVLLPDSVGKSDAARAPDLRSLGNHRLLDRNGVPTGDRIIRHLIVGEGVPLATSHERASRIARGEHQVRSVDGIALRYPSQQLDLIESAKPFERGQTHTITKHVDQSLADNVRRIARDRVPAAGGFTDLETAQHAVDNVIADPPSQTALRNFLKGPTSTILPRTP